MIIYKITNKINGKVYIGQTIHSLSYRKSQHLRCANNGVDRHLYNAMRKYGIENFEFEEIDRADNIDDLNYLETYYIIQYDSVRKGYNMCYGGDNNVMFSDIVYQKHLERVRSKEIRNKVSEGMKKKIAKGEFFTEAHRKKLSDKAKGNKNGEGNPSHSIGCYCIIDGMRRDFNNYKEAGIWWYMKDKPFGDKYSQATYQRKIIDCIETGECKFQRKDKSYVHITKDNIEWYRK